MFPPMSAMTLDTGGASPSSGGDGSASDEWGSPAQNGWDSPARDGLISTAQQPVFNAGDTVFVKKEIVDFDTPTNTPTKMVRSKVRATSRQVTPYHTTPHHATPHHAPRSALQRVGGGDEP